MLLLNFTTVSVTASNFCRVAGNKYCVIPYGKQHPVVLRWISIKNLSLL